MPGLFRLSLRTAVEFWLFSTAVLAVAVVMAPPLPAGCLIGLGLAVGGASGNLVDRLLRGSVIDFIGLGQSLRFNLADAAMVSGVVVTAWSLLYG
jgi:signal peptidase II